ACWPRGKIPPHPSARSARHSSPQNGGPKGKMIEGRSGGSGRGTRRELGAPPDSGSSTSGSYVTGGERAAEGEDGGHRWHDAGSERSHALDCATGYGRGLRGVSAAPGRGIGDRNADTGAVGEAGPQAGEEGIERRLGESA